MRLLAISCFVCATLVAGSAYWLLRADVDVAVPAVVAATHADTMVATPVATAPTNDRRADLERARRTCDRAQLDRFLDQQRALVQQSPTDPAVLTLCAQGLLERIMLGNQSRGMSVGTPMYDSVPALVAADVDEALGLLRQARSAGDDSATSYRLEAALLGNRITGLGAALQWNGRIEAALAKAAERDDRDPQLHVALGLKKLLAPRLLGHDPDAALRHLEYAARALVDDERPRVFAAMAAHELEKRQQAISWLEQAVQLNPANVFARAVLARVRRGESDPFGRDVTADEAARK